MTLVAQINALATAIGGQIKSIKTSLSSLDNPNLPSYAPKNLLNSWDASMSAYNCTGATKHKVRASTGKLAGSAASLHMLFAGDSTLIGYDGSVYSYNNSIPRRCGRALASILGGGANPTQGITLAMANPGAVSDRWSLTGAFLTGIASSTNLLACTGAGTATWTSLDMGTSVEFYYSDLSGTFSWSVDGASTGANQGSIVTGGTATIKKVTVSGLTNGIHSIKFTVAAGSGTTYLAATRIFNPNITQLHIHSLALGGSRANSGSAYQNWSDSSSAAGLGNVAKLIWAASGLPAPDILVAIVGNNDAAQNVASPTIVTGLGNLKSYWPNSPALFVHPPAVAGTDITLFNTLSGAFFTFADTNGVMYADWNDYSNGVTSYTADGLPGADGVHPTQAAQIMVGRWLANVIGDTPDRAIDNLAQYRVVASGGVYPARPNVPAGQVLYVGTTQPTDWLDGDGWDDTT